ncbi:MULTISPECIES: hypothetical protein [Pantoea]|uniref:hypothetical protein n=1 Tax=Pantoea TaxID=53335 RepID=UPI00244A7E91|nr:hypothetical protein [Pantoea sp. GD03673]MCJ7925581.1 hypothetical protein [Pantoea vagans]MDH2068688.1 hypothetical protein [Pantoea sp. GD03673]
MLKFPKGSIVKHQSGEIRGEIINVFEQGSAPAGYYVKWDDGNLSYHPEQELSWANIDRPRMHYTQQSIK